MELTLGTDEMAGACLNAGAARKTPVFLSYHSQWNGLSESVREALIFHEMGHCLLAAPHGDGIMRALLLDGFSYEVNRSKWIEELFACHSP